MKRVVIVSAALAGLVFLVLLPVRGAETSDITLFDAPRGAWIATLRGDAPVTVLEERSGWRRVQVEGWVAGSTTPAGGEAAPSATIPSVAAPSPSVAEPLPVQTGAAVRGVLLPSAGDRAATPGAGLIVLLVSDLPALDAEHARAGEECRAGMDAADARIATLRAQYDKALNSTATFRDATTLSDRLKKEIRAEEKARQERIVACLVSADGLLQAHAMQRAITDSAGRFEFDRVPPGIYRLVATEAGVHQPRAWALDCVVTGPGILVLDPRKDASAFKPYWGLR
jgi:hypothetical protein